MLLRRTVQKAATATRAASASASVPARQASSLSVLRVDEEWPGIPALKPAHDLPVPETEMTTLSNGLRIASQETYGQSSCIGVLVDSGSRFENDANNGASHLLEHMAFKTTENRSHLRLVRDMEDAGANVGAATAREHVMYAVNVLREKTDTAVEVLADTLLRPTLADWELGEQKQVVGYEIADLQQQPQVILSELIHAAAYGDDTPMGRPLFCPQRNLGSINGADLTSFMNETYTADRMVLAGAGVDHAELVRLGESFFGDHAGASGEVAKEKAVYRGGDSRLRGESDFTHVTIGFGVEGWNDPDLVPLCVLHMLLGGGSSFSAGGPGKGMYSRLYQEVLNKHYQVDTALAFNSMYTDAGIFGITGSSHHAFAGELSRILLGQVTAAASKAPAAEELNRAKNALASSVLMNLEQKDVLFEDIGRQVLTYGHREAPSSLVAKIQAVTGEQVMAAAQKVTKSPLSVAAFGDVNKVPRYDELAAMLN
jgi:processing peptidase subunit alpha